MKKSESMDTQTTLSMSKKHRSIGQSMAFLNLSELILASYVIFLQLFLLFCINEIILATLFIFFAISTCFLQLHNSLSLLIEGPLSTALVSC